MFETTEYQELKAKLYDMQQYVKHVEAALKAANLEQREADAWKEKYYHLEGLYNKLSAEKDRLAAKVLDDTEARLVKLLAEALEKHGYLY